MKKGLKNSKVEERKIMEQRESEVRRWKGIKESIIVTKHLIE
jgi:hypothetical protein